MSLGRAYRAAVRLYPRSVRREFGDDMVALFEDQLRDEPAHRVLGRTVVDLLVSVPTRHLEVHMSRSSSTPVAVAFAVVGVALVLVGGVLPVATGLAAITLAGLTWSRSRPVTTGARRRWRALLLAGVALLTGVVGVTTSTGELSSTGWLVAMALGASSLVLIAAGVAIGASSRFRTA